MKILRRSAERGHADHGWLDARHTFSFAGYLDPDWMGFGLLRVLNQDKVEPARGFGTHPHQDMEIVTYVLDGELEHRDSMGHGERIVPGEVQLMSAGTGVQHSEVNPSGEHGLELLQMWVHPARRGTEPRYEQEAYPESERRGALRLVVSPDGADGSLTIGQDARLYAGLLDGEETITHALAPGRRAWLHLARGRMTLDGEPLEAGDGVGFVDHAGFTLTAGEDAEFVLWDLPDTETPS